MSLVFTRNTFGCVFLIHNTIYFVSNIDIIMCKYKMNFIWHYIPCIFSVTDILYLLYQFRFGQHTKTVTFAELPTYICIMYATAYLCWQRFMRITNFPIRLISLINKKMLKIKNNHHQ